MNNDTPDNKIDTLKADVKDGVDEAKHRAQAAAEHASRDLQGDKQPLGERIASNVKEAGHNFVADVDKAKREARHDDTPDGGN
jgi:F0F1-type ATP synthase membrane subunit b/b'